MKKITFLLLTFLPSVLLCQVFFINNGADLHIDTGTVFTVSGSFSNQNSGTVDNDGTLQIADNFNNTGNFDQDTGLVVLNGSTGQRLDGNSSTFYFLTINNTGSGVSVATGVHQIRHTLTFIDGDLTTNDSIVLLSDAALTARIAEMSPKSSIIGDITQERYLDNGVTGWHIIGTATSGGDLSQWSDDFATSGFPGSTAPSFPFNNIYTYVESDTSIKDTGYHGATNITDVIKTGLGYWTYIGPVPLTIDSKGPANTFIQSWPINYTNNKDVIHDGWNMVANPYPSDISWDEPGWTKVNVDDAIYFYDPDNGVYASYISGIGTNGGGPLIASSQGFWVKANAVGASITTNEQVKTDAAAKFYRQKAGLSAAPTIRLKVANNFGTSSDETVLAFWQNATGGWDATYDAYKLEDDYSPAPYIATVLGKSDLSVNTFPEIAAEGSVPLRVKVKSSGTYTMQINRKGIINIDNCLYLEDLDNDSITDLKKDSLYSFFISDTVQSPRFIIHTNPKPDLGPDTFVVRGGSVHLDAGDGFTSYFWSNGSTSRFLEVTEPGEYEVQVQNEFGCVGTDKIIVGLDSLTGIYEDNGEFADLDLYPNPASDFFHLNPAGLENGVYELRLYNYTGVLLHQRELTITEDEQHIKVKVSHLAQGNYYLRLQGSNGVVVKKLIISR